MLLSIISTGLLLSYSVLPTFARCDSYSPAFQLPYIDPAGEEINQARDAITKSLANLLEEVNSTTISFSVEVTSQTETLFELFHTASDRDEDRPGADYVDGTSRYRIASMTKPFTVLAIIQQQIAGKLSLDDPINKYVPGLGEKSKGGIPWKDISIRSLASQLSGIPRDMAQQDLLVDMDDPLKLGLPPVKGSHLAKCDSVTNFSRSCTGEDLLHYLHNKEPLFPPKQQSTYSNMNFELLSLALENVTGISYEEYIVKHVLAELKLSDTSFDKPSDTVAVLPKEHHYYWDVEMGIQNPTGGLYSTSADIAKFVRYVLTHYNGLTPALNWISPVSYSTGLHTFYGMPWEILRTNNLIPYTDRPITFVTKGGSLPGYKSIMVMAPEYGFGFTVLVAGEGGVLHEIVGIIGQHMLAAAEKIAQRQLSHKHVGTFSAQPELGLNSSITLSHTPAKGLYISAWTSNATDTLWAMSRYFLDEGEDLDNSRFQLVPTLLYKDEANQKGEIWRILPLHSAGAHDEDQQAAGASDVLDDFCMTDIDFVSYGGLPLNEVVFWSADKHGIFDEIELIGFRIKLNRTTRESDTAKQVLQDTTTTNAQMSPYDVAGQKIIKTHLRQFTRRYDGPIVQSR